MNTDATSKAAPGAGAVHLSVEARELLGFDKVVPRENGLRSVVHAMKFR